MSMLRTPSSLALLAGSFGVVAAVAALAVPSAVFAQSPRDLIVDSLRSQFGVDEAAVKCGPRLDLFLLRFGSVAG